MGDGNKANYNRGGPEIPTPADVPADHDLAGVPALKELDQANRRRDDPGEVLGEGLKRP